MPLREGGETLWKACGTAFSRVAMVNPSSLQWQHFLLVDRHIHSKSSTVLFSDQAKCEVSVVWQNPLSGLYRVEVHGISSTDYIGLWVTCLVLSPICKNLMWMSLKTQNSQNFLMSCKVANPPVFKLFFLEAS